MKQHQWALSLSSCIVSKRFFKNWNRLKTSPQLSIWGFKCCCVEGEPRYITKCFQTQRAAGFTASLSETNTRLDWGASATQRKLQGALEQTQQPWVYSLAPRAKLQVDANVAWPRQAWLIPLFWPNAVTRLLSCGNGKTLSQPPKMDQSDRLDTRTEREPGEHFKWLLLLLALPQRRHLQQIETRGVKWSKLIVIN